MNRDNRDVDRLLKTNVDGQLTGFDWDRLAQRVGHRLAADEFRRRSSRPVICSLAVAATVVLIVGIVVFVLLHRETPNLEPIPISGRATVVIARRDAEKGAGRCEVTILSPTTPKSEEAAGRPSWCIVTTPQPLPVSVSRERDSSSLACLF